MKVEMCKFWELIQKYNLIVLLIFSVISLVCYYFEVKWNDSLGVSDEVALYISNLLHNFALGYIVSYIFYLIVVFFPESKRKKIVKEKTSVIFLQLKILIFEFLKTTLIACGEKIEEGDDLRQKWDNIGEDFKISCALNEEKLKESVIAPDLENNIERIYEYEIDDNPPIPIKLGTYKYLDYISEIANEIVALKNELKQFLVFLEGDELKFYIDIVNMSIFDKIKSYTFQRSRINKISKNQFRNDFGRIIDLYFLLKRLDLSSAKDTTFRCSIKNDIY